MTNKVLSCNLNMRLDAKELNIFKKKATRLTGKPYQILMREIISAFNDGRLRIIQSKEKVNSSIYIEEQEGLNNVD